MDQSNGMVANVSDFKAQSYNGNYEASEGKTVVAGTLATNSDKVLTNFSGNVKVDGAPVGTFNGWWNGTKIKYNISDCELENLAVVASAISAAQAAVEAEIKDL